jgi:transposase-like protein
LKRNVRRNVSPQAYQEIAQILNRIKNSPDFEAGPEIRKHIYTTNFAESINSSLEKVRINQHRYFHSVENLELNVYLLNELSKKWSKPPPYY